MDMKSMKMTKEDMRGPMSEPVDDMDEQDAYPYGLQINLDEKSMDKLDMPDMPEVGAEMMLMAKVKVNNVHQSDSAGGGKHVSVGLQITDMALMPAKEKASTADKMYAKGKGK